MNGTCNYLIIFIHHFKSDLINNMDHMRISGTESSSVILSQRSIFKSWKDISKTCQNKLKPKGVVHYLLSTEAHGMQHVDDKSVGVTYCLPKHMVYSMLMTSLLVLLTVGQSTWYTAYWWQVCWCNPLAWKVLLLSPSCQISWCIRHSPYPQGGYLACNTCTQENVQNA